LSPKPFQVSYSVVKTELKPLEPLLIRPTTQNSILGRKLTSQTAVATNHHKSQGTYDTTSKYDKIYKNEIVLGVFLVFFVILGVLYAYLRSSRGKINI
jgi:hypothetical protein